MLPYYFFYVTYMLRCMWHLWGDLSSNVCSVKSLRVLADGLDRAGQAAAFHADADVALAAYDEPVLLDEWQEVPAVLGAVKRAVDDDPRPGRFVLTGSVWADLSTATWPGTGRVVRIPLYGLTVRELEGATWSPSLLDRLATAELDAVSLPGTVPDLRGYIELALRGGFPEAVLHLRGTGRQAWLEGYLDQIVTRDALGLEPRRDPVRLRRFVEALSLMTAGVVRGETLLEATGLNRKTATAYEQLLTNLLVVDQVPAWSTNRLSRLVKMPKRYLVDPSLLGAVLRATPRAVLSDGDLLGRLLDTFVLAQLRPELTVSPLRPRLYHIRQDAGRREVDLLAELGADRVIGLEVKATSAPSASDARHLAWLRDQLGEKFVAGAVLHTGPATFRLGERIFAVPVCAFWA
jgi:predicted AAA+ superfamily ATPase